MSKNFYFGIVESRDDPLKLGRVRVRIVGCHTSDSQLLPTEDLPWASLLDANKGIPREGTPVSIAFWDYPENQMPVVTGILSYIPQRDSVFIDKAEKTANVKDSLTPNGRSIPTNENESSGGIDTNVPLDKNNPPANVKSAIQKSYTESSDSQTAMVNVMVNDSTSKIGAIGTLAQQQLSVGKSEKSTVESLYDNISKYGDIAKAQLATVQSLASELGTSLPTDLLSGLTNPSEMMSSINETLQSLTSGLGSGIAGNLVSKLADGATRAIGNKLTSTVMNKMGSSGMTTLTQVSSVVGSGARALESGNLTSKLIDGATRALGNKATSMVSRALGSEGFTTLTQAQNMLSTLNMGSFTDFSGMIGTGLSSLSSELSSMAQNAVDSLLSKGDGLGSALSSLSNISLDSISLPAELNSLVSKFGDLGNALIEDANGLIGKGFSSAMAMANDIGGVKSAEELVKKAEEEIKDLKKTHISLTTETFKNAKVAEGATPPTTGNSGGANYGGANATNTTAPKQDTEKYSCGTERNVDTSNISSKGDIDILLSVAKECGITTTESQATYLAIIYAQNGGFVPTTERANYTEDELRRFFPITFGKASSDVVRNYSLGKKSDKAFLTFVYDSANDGITYGNQYPSDGELYYPYGYIKIIGRSAFTRYAKILDNPQLITKGVTLLLDDKNLCAKISAMEFLERTKTLPPTAHPNFFYQCCNIFGVEQNKAESTYLSLFGASSQDYMGVGNKIAGASRNSSAIYQYSGDSTNYGFSDPNKKYPTEDEICEPSLSKLSRGDIKNSIVSLKEQKRKIGVPLPFNMGSWNQPHPSYGAKYPFNRVEESESGHVIEVDDTPNRERLHWYHRSGTFTEIDASGVKVQRIVGDNYVITDRNGYISIEGEADVTVSGNINVYCRSNANVQVEGSANIEVGRNLDIGVAKDINIRTEGDFNVWANGDFNLQAKNNGHILAKENLYASGDKTVHVLAGYVTKDSESNDVKNAGNLFVESYGNSDYRSLGNTKLYTQGDLSDKVVKRRYNEVGQYINNLWLSDVVTSIAGKHDIGVCGATKMSSGGATDIKVGANFNVTSGSEANIKASSNVNVDGSEIHLNEGKSKDASSPSSPISEKDFKEKLPQLLSVEAVKALIHGMIPPQLGTPLNVRLSPVEIPPCGDVDGVFDSLEDINNETFSSVIETSNALEGKVSVDIGRTESVSPFSGSGSKIDNVIGAKFGKDYKLSDHFTLGDLTVNSVFPHSIPSGGQKGLTEEEIVTNLKALAVNVLEKVIPYLPNGINGKGKDWRITSGFRKDLSGSSGSQHTKGQAVDIQIFEKGNNVQTSYNTIKTICENIPFDQAILEYSSRTGNCWMHLSYKNSGANRKSMLTMNNRFPNKYASGFRLC